MITAYVVHFDPLGYYAENQPRYEWSFTNDIDKAKTYLTESAALERLEHGIGLARTKNSSLKAKEPMLCITSGTIDEVRIEIAFSNTIKVIDITPKVSLVSEKLWQRIRERIVAAQKSGKYSASLNSIADNGEGVRGLGMYLTPSVYNELCEKLMKEYGVCVKLETGPMPHHKIFWSKFNLPEGA